VSVRGATFRTTLVAGWVVLAAATLYLFVFQRTAIQARLSDATSASAIAGGAVYLALGCLRAMSLLPATSLLLLALPFFPPRTLFVLTVAGILVSSACIYLFAQALHLSELIERRHAPILDRLRRALTRHGFLVITGWSFFPLAPTDAICYVAGILRLGLLKCLAGVAIGEGAICAIYIFTGEHVLRLWNLK
jgi:uncharacterized membrane protein YdjX (TVP38/TMEM64 family)